MTNNLPDLPATKGPAHEPITGRMVFRAACRMQRQGLPIATGASRDWFVERKVDAGDLITDGRSGTPSDGYLAAYTINERVTVSEKLARQDDPMRARFTVVTR